ncbi:MAG: hypothetical protein ISS33_00595 [Candidatus Omnitrophica bacterium]|nr:hypothetical protein [Candidatus Omnitrophota bacterium]
MSEKNKCGICGKTAKRACGGIGGVICSACCGGKRNSEITCSSDCVHSPFSTTGYDLWLKVDAGLIRRCIRRVISNYGKVRFNAVMEEMSFEEIPSEESFVVEAGAAVYNLLFVERDNHGKTLADEWESQSWEGLNNDEKVMMRYSKSSRVTIIEVQKILNYQAMECIDMFDPERKPFIMFDRSTASNAVRFVKIFSWLTHFPNFSRMSHSGIEVTDFVFNEFMDTINLETRKESKRAGFKVKDHLSKNFGKYCRLITNLALTKREAMLDTIDVHQCVATYGIEGKASEVGAILEKYPEFRWNDKDPEEDDPADTLYYDWVRTGESKAIEKEMHPAFHHNDESLGVGTLANVCFRPDKLVIEVFSKRKYKFAKKMVIRYFGSLVVLKQEKIVDIAKQLKNKPIDEISEEKEKRAVMPPEEEEKILQAFYENKYRKFIDENIPMIDNKTPRQAAKEPGLRPKLIELIKSHINSLEKMNRQKSINLNIDWVLDELGLSEMKI